MTQTPAIFYDAYRDLAARRLFWITLILSAVAIGGFGMLGVSKGSLDFLTYHLDTRPFDAHGLYISIFSNVVIGFWLTWIAVALALVSTAGIFPDLLVSGTIDLYLARPMGRLRFFLTKYLSGLLFAALQVGVFALGSFLVLGIRGKVWQPSLFLAIPLVVCAFSYLFAICVVLGVWTRSTIGALMLTLLIWGMYSGLFWADQKIFDWMLEARSMSPGNQAAVQGDKTVDAIDRFVRVALVPMPKIVPTTRLLDRWIQKKSDIMIALGLPSSDDDTGWRFGPRVQASDADREEAYSRATGGDPAYTLGSSLIFEAVFVGLAAWIFCRRDY
ncbi:MAG TPA: ABC transporter permease [Tepidisphaeraceae bacterium]|nr:ABC transporter permease [Tepidisphaeraceae bacterium]